MGFAGAGGWRSVRRRGFALVAALALMAFLVLLIVSLSALARVETGASRAARQLALAKHQALFALDLALADLARHVGDDRSVSARADLLGEVAPDSETALWTGAWSVFPDGSGGRVEGPVWLVSGEASVPGEVAAAAPAGRAGPGAEAILLRSGREGLAPVVVPLVSVEGEGGDAWPLGRYAYWVGDENVKARIVTEAEETAWAGVAEANSAAAFLRREVYAGAFADPLDPDAGWRAQLASVQVPRQTRFLDGFDGEAFLAASDHFSVYGEGLPVDTVRGGWKRVVRPDALEATLPAPFADAARYFDHGRNFDRFSGRPGVALAMDGNMPLLPADVEIVSAFSGFHPVLTEVAVKCGVFHATDDATRDVRIRFHIEFEIYNPYAFPLDLGHAAGDDEPYELVVSGMPRVLVTNLTREDRLLADIDLQRALDFRGIATPPMVWVGLRELADGGRYLMMPGEVLRLREPRQPQGLVRTDPGGRQFADPEMYGQPGDEIEVELLFPPDYRGTAFKLVQRPAGGDERPDEEDKVVFAVTGVPFEDDRFIPTLSRRFFLSRSDGYTEEDYSFGFHFKLFDDPLGPDGLAAYARGFDLRRPVINFVEHPDRFEVLSRRPGEIAIIDDFFSDLDGFGNRRQVTGMDGSPQRVRTDRDVRLYDVPETNLWTLGALRHAPLEDWPPYSLGEPGRRGLNEVFDTHMVEPVASVAWLRETETPGNDGDPGLRVRGAFNVHSTSVDAWRAILAMGLRDYAVDRGAAAPRALSAEAAYFRHPFGAAMLRTVGEDGPGPDGLYREGLRSFAAEALQPLAEAVVDGVRREGPFPSVAAFLESGVITDALAQSGLNTGLPEASPGYVRQGDVVEALAPFLSARSDTFVVRAYGDVLNPATGRVEGRAACEAVVRRTGAVVPLAASEYEREFEVISFRWLDWKGGWSE